MTRRGDVAGKRNTHPAINAPAARREHAGRDCGEAAQDAEGGEAGRGGRGERSETGRPAAAKRRRHGQPFFPRRS